MKEAKVLTSLVCKHCGDQCIDEQIYFEEKVFCCYGCKAVYELLSASEMLNYYRNDDLTTSKISVDLRTTRKYAFLDNEQVVKKLLKYQDDQKSVVKFYLPAIHCSSCIYLLEHLPRLERSVVQSQVNFIRKEITVTFMHEALSFKELAILLTQLGYPPQINLDALDSATSKKHINNDGLKIAVAGFCFGNSMLMSLPEYLDTGFQLEDQFKELFNWINLIVSLPIVFFAGKDYFKNALVGLRKKYLNIDVPIALGILTLFLRSTFEIVSQTGDGYVDSLAGLVFFLLIGKWYQNKSYQALSFDRDYKSYFPIAVTLLSNNEEKTVLIEELEKSDQILIRNQELIPADAIILDGDASLDYSFVSGESELVSKGINDKVFAGGRQIGAPIIIQLLDKVNNSELTQLWNNQVFEKEKDLKYEMLIDKVSQYFTLVIILLALSTAFYWYLFNPALMWNAVSAVLIVACPCALALTLPFAYGHGMRILGRNGLYLKSAQVIERLAQIKEIIFDKTGTLTQVGKSSLEYKGTTLTNDELALVKSVAANSSHPLSKLISQNIPDSIEKLPLSHFVELIGKGSEAEVMNRKIYIGSSKWLGVEQHNPQSETTVFIKIDDEVKGYFLIKSAYRQGIFQALKHLKSLFKLHLLSGDGAKEYDHLSLYFNDLSFNQKPEDKLDFIRNLKSPSLMIGDGLNDAGALRASHVGFGVAEDIYQFTPACDGVLAADSVVKLSDVLKFSTAIKSIVIFAFVISFSYNIIGLSFAVSGHLTPIISAILMPISSLTVVGLITLLVELQGKRYLGKND